MTTGFAPRQGAWWCDDVPLADIARTTGTPTYVYSAAAVRERYRQLAGALVGTPHTIHYALKANSTLGLARLLQSLGASADANSIGEIDVALRAGFIPAQIVFTGVGKSPDELERAVSLGLKAINVESRGELERIDAIARRQGTRARVAIRVNPDVDARSHPHISTGLRRNKFGVPLGEVPSLWRGLADAAGLELVGVHVHVGSQITSLEPLASAAEKVAALARELRDAGVTLEHLDLGGGLGIDYEGGPGPDVVAYAGILADAARSTGLSLIVEPGRWLVARAGVLLARIVDVKPVPGGERTDGPSRQFVVLDAGMTELLRPALYGAFHRIVRVEPAEGPEVPCDIVGPVCESSDAFGGERTLVDPKVGDLVAILDAGAYGAVMSSNYNRRPFQPEALVDGAAWRLIRRRQTVEDMVMLECP